MKERPILSEPLILSELPIGYWKSETPITMKGCIQKVAPYIQTRSLIVIEWYSQFICGPEHRRVSRLLLAWTSIIPSGHFINLNSLECKSYFTRFDGEHTFDAYFEVE